MTLSLTRICFTDIPSSRILPLNHPPVRDTARVKQGAPVPLELKFLIFQSLIIIPFIAGSIMRGSVKDPAALSKHILRANLTLIEPPIILWSIWGLAIRSDLAFLPVAGLMLVTAGFLLGGATLPLLTLRGTGKKTYLISASLANHGFTMGGFICYLFLNETGLGLSSIFLIYFIPYTFIIIFTYARAGQGGLTLASLKDIITDARNLPLLSSVTALALLATGVPRPDLPVPVDILIMMSILLYYLTLGLAFELKDVRALGIVHLVLGSIKFIILPAATFLVLRLVELDREVALVIQIQSFMPAAVYSVVTSVLFDLDGRLASSLFVVNTLVFMVLVFPLLFLLHSFGLL